jgi:hypothetical protein
MAFYQWLTCVHLWPVYNCPPVYRMSMELHAVHSNVDTTVGDYVVVSYFYEATLGSCYT